MILIIRISYFILLTKMSQFWIRFQSDRGASIAIKSLNSQRFLMHNQLVSHTVVNIAVDSGCAVSNHVMNVNVCALLPLMVFTNSEVSAVNALVLAFRILNNRGVILCSP